MQPIVSPLPSHFGNPSSSFVLSDNQVPISQTHPTHPAINTNCEFQDQVTTTTTSTEGLVLEDRCNTQSVATEVVVPKSVEIGRCRGRTNSPGSSPHKLGKNGPKRRRTVSVRKLELQMREKQHRQDNSSTLRMEDFQETLEETRAIKDLSTNLFAYNIKKYAIEHSPDSNNVLSDVRSFLDDAHGCDDLMSSHIYYMELIDENPDSAETMMMVAEELIEKFGTECNAGWVVLVGDGKTYMHLMQIKCQYGSSLEKLLIFPGDWHTLKNYQETLMKVYYSAGLKEIAKESGYHGQTLTSLEICSNFKRTHNFLLQVWEALY